MFVGAIGAATGALIALALGIQPPYGPDSGPAPLLQAWLPMIAICGFTAGSVSFLMGPLRRRWVVGFIHKLRYILSPTGLALTILGLSLSFTCGSSCKEHPFRTIGLVAVAIGFLLSVAGITLLFASPNHVPPG